VSLPTILLTGATGFLGSHLLKTLLNKGHKVVIFKRTTSDIYRIQDNFNKIISYNVDTQSLDLAFKEQKIDVVIHTAGQYGRDGCGIVRIIESNVIFGVNLLAACKKYNTKVFINTDTLLQPNASNYSLSKKHFTDWLKCSSNNIQIINLKLEHIYGVGDDNKKFVAWILSQLTKNVSKIKLTTGIQQRDFIYVSDVVSAYLKVLDKRKSLSNFSEFEVGTGKPILVREFVEKILLHFQKIKCNPKTKLLFGAVPYRENEAMVVCANTANLRNIGWNPSVSVDEGLSKIIKELP